MKKKTKYIIALATLIYITSVFLPSRLTSYDLETFISFAKSGQIGYSTYIILTFPIALILVHFKKLKSGFIISTLLLLTNTTLFENFLDVVFSKTELTFQLFLNRSLPFLIYSVVLIGLCYQAFKKLSWIRYYIFIGVLITSYVCFNESNCTFIFLSDVGIKTYNPWIWFQNCGTYYAWWTAPILLNIGLFNQIIPDQRYE